jgi:hypothetical protein
LKRNLFQEITDGFDALANERKGRVSLNVIEFTVGLSKSDDAPVQKESPECNDESRVKQGQ